MNKIFIDGKEGTTGLKIYDRLKHRSDISVFYLDDDKRKDVAARKEALNSCSIAFLCLPDAAAKEAVELIENQDVKVIDASTAHRTSAGWVYGMPELSEDIRKSLKTAKRVAVPGCHASGFVAIVYPLVKEKLIEKDARLCCFSLTGYSGGGKKMIAEYENEDRSPLLSAPRIYALTQQHKHLREMCHVTGLENAPAFSPIVADYYSGMAVTVPVFGIKINTLKELYSGFYNKGLIEYGGEVNEAGFLSASALSGYDNMKIYVEGVDGRATVTARFDNLGKGASGAAVQCMNIMLGLDETEGLKICR